MAKHIGFIVLLFFIASLFAPAIASAQKIDSSELVTLFENEEIHQDYFATGETISLSGTVNGDAYIAGKTVFVDGLINGDLIIAGGTVTIRGTVKEDLRVLGGSVTITGTVDKNITALGGTVVLTNGATIGGSLTAGAGTLHILSPLGKGATIAAGKTIIGSTINGNVTALIDDLTLTDTASIQGDLLYYSDFEGNLTKSDSATVSGEIIHTIPIHDPALTNKNNVFSLSGVGLFIKLLSLFSSLLLGLILLQFTPRFTNRTVSHIEKKPFISILFGGLFFILSPILIFLLFITLVGIPFAIIFILLLTGIVFFAKVFAIMFIGQQLIKYLNQKASHQWILVLGIVAYGLLTAIPIFGFILSVLSVCAGAGALLIEKKNLYKSLHTKKII